MKDKKSFEENLDKLKESVRSLEKGELPLKETLEKFEEGLKLSKLCNEELEVAQKKIEKIIEIDGKPTVESFEEKIW